MVFLLGKRVLGRFFWGDEEGKLADLFWECLCFVEGKESCCRVSFVLGKLCGFRHELEGGIIGDCAFTPCIEDVKYRCTRKRA